MFEPEIYDLIVWNIKNLNNGDWGLGIGDWGLGIGDWGLAQSPIPNPQSPIPNPQKFSSFFSNESI